jgi:hypothetical protein
MNYQSGIVSSEINSKVDCEKNDCYENLLQTIVESRSISEVFLDS